MRVKQTLKKDLEIGISRAVVATPIGTRARGELFHLPRVDLRKRLGSDAVKEKVGSARKSARAN